MKARFFVAGGRQQFPAAINVFFLLLIFCSESSWGNVTPSNETRILQRKPKWPSEGDPNSFSNPEAINIKSLHLNWEVDFSQKIISGFASYKLQIIQERATQLILDTRDLTIFNVTTNDGKALPFQIGPTVDTFGEALIIAFGHLGYKKGDTLAIKIDYETSPKSTALQWLDPLQTAGKIYPYVFSQCEAINARSLIPCQDTPSVKFIYTAIVSAPKNLQVVMSALLQNNNDSGVSEENKIFHFEQKTPISSYLIAIAVGDVIGKKIGPRSFVWSEREIVEAAASEFDATEDMVATAESLFGAYVWDQYNILVLPPSFMYGGMENPTMTFVTPTLIAGDKSMVNVIAHEIAHSWTGNLVTNKNWEHFWLNEGFTKFAERKILGVLQGEKFRQFELLGGYKDLTKKVQELGSTDPITALVPDLNGVDPDGAFSIIPYEKGSHFLYYLEQKVGGPKFFNPFLRHYIETFSFKSVVTDDFKNLFVQYFDNIGKPHITMDIDWDAWLYSKGMPPVENHYDTSLYEACILLKNQWVDWDPTTEKSPPFKKSDVDNLLPKQIRQFLSELHEVDNFPLEKIEALEKVYELNGRKNAEIRFKWILLSIKAKWTDIIPNALQFINSQGRLRYLRPIYKDIYNNWEEMRSLIVENFEENEKFMMYGLATKIREDLHLK